MDPEAREPVVERRIGSLAAMLILVGVSTGFAVGGIYGGAAFWFAERPSGVDSFFDERLFFPVGIFLGAFAGTLFGAVCGAAAYGAFRIANHHLPRVAVAITTGVVTAIVATPLSLFVIRGSGSVVASIAIVVGTGAGMALLAARHQRRSS